MIVQKQIYTFSFFIIYFFLQGGGKKKDKNHIVGIIIF